MSLWGEEEKEVVNAEAVDKIEPWAFLLPLILLLSACCT
jgi:hypothetical protein